jgi:hypothetical protein
MTGPEAGIDLWWLPLGGLAVHVPEGRRREAVASPRRLSDDPGLARHLLALVGELPSRAWGRDELATGEMWNSNSVIAWLLAHSGLPTDAIRPPARLRTRTG